MRKRATIRDVAALAGVSLKTVSRVINGEPRVSPDLAERVHRAAEQLDYRHNLAASNLRRGQRTSSIGVLLDDLHNEFSSRLLRAVEDRASADGIAVYSASLDRRTDRETAYVTDLLSRRVDGLVLVPAGADQAYLASDIRAGLAVVAVDRPARGLDIDTVVADNEGGAAGVAAHLTALGHRRIACLTDVATIWTAAERRRGFESGLAAADVALDPRLLHVDVATADDAERLVLGLLDLAEPPTALFTARNDITVGAVRALRQRRRAREVALVGFDDFPMADLLEPAVTVVRQDVSAAGLRAAELLLARMAGGDGPASRTVLPTELVPRGTGEIRPVGSVASE